MYIKALVAVRFLEPSRAPIDPSAVVAPAAELLAGLISDDPERQRAIDQMMVEREKTFREEVAELLGTVTAEEAAAVRSARSVSQRLHVFETHQGVRRLELGLHPGSELLQLVPEAVLEAAIDDRRLSYFQAHRGGRQLELVGEPAALYCLGKTRRLGAPFDGEWSGRVSSEHFLTVLAAVREAERLSRSDSRPRAVARWSTLEERQELFKTLDGTLSGPLGKDCREVIEAAGIEWRRWRRVGYGFRARWELEKTYF